MRRLVDINLADSLAIIGKAAADVTLPQHTRKVAYLSSKYNVSNLMQDSWEYGKQYIRKVVWIMYNLSDSHWDLSR